MKTPLSHHGDLEAFRFELDILVLKRSACGLMPIDKLRYQELCEWEKALLQRVAQLGYETSRALR
jgi:hypothetical protein